MKVSKTIVLRSLVAMAAMGIVAGAFCFYGWRYGFTPLPEPLGDSAFFPQAGIPWAEIGTNNFWYWLREMDQVIPVSSRSPLLDDFWFGTGSWAQSGNFSTRGGGRRPGGEMDATRREQVNRWLEERPQIEELLQRALASSDRRPPESLGAAETRAFMMLATYPVWQAAQRFTDQRSAEAFNHLVTSWRFHAMLTPNSEFPGFFDERGVEQLNMMLAKPWRRIALQGPAIPLADGKRILEALTQVTNSVTSLEQAYRRIATRSLGQAQLLWTADWPRVRAAFRIAWLRVRQELGRLVTALLERALGSRRTSELRLEGIRHFGRPMTELTENLQRAAARRQDYKQMQAAVLSRDLARVRAGSLRVVPGTVDSSRADLKTPKRLFFDRPAVWRSVRGLPQPESIWQGLASWYVYFESCRVTLALRMYRDLHGQWPDRLEDLVPEILPATPLDPFSGEPFGYERTGDTWQFWSVGSLGRRPTAAEAEQTPQRLFTSEPDPPR